MKTKIFCAVFSVILLSVGFASANVYDWKGKSVITNSTWTKYDPDGTTYQYQLQENDPVEIEGWSCMMFVPPLNNPSGFEMVVECTKQDQFSSIAVTCNNKHPSTNLSMYLGADLSAKSFSGISLDCLLVTDTK